MRHGSLFSGIGGFDLAAQWMGWDNVFHCEWMPFPRKVLNYYWPNAISYEDITKTDFTIHRGGIDILTGGFPCQPYSLAGARKGKEDSRHLWPEMLRAIREIRPNWIVGENVYGIANWNEGLVFEEVCSELENEGYKVQPYIIPAAGVGSVHKRDRVWFIANARNSGDSADRRKIQREAIKEDEGREESCSSPRQQVQLSDKSSALFRDVSDSDNEGLQRSKDNRIIGSSREESYQQPSRFICTGWENFPTQPPICGGDDGLPTRLDGITFHKWRNESIKGYGNAVVPQVVYQIFKTIEEYERL